MGRLRPVILPLPQRQQKTSLLKQQFSPYSLVLHLCFHQSSLRDRKTFMKTNRSHPKQSSSPVVPVLQQISLGEGGPVY